MSAAIALPVLSLVWTALSGPDLSWDSVVSDTSLTALVQTFILCAGVAVIVTLLGVGSAWLVTAYEFKSRRMLSWALLLPLSVPTYLAAYVYIDLLHPLGPVQEFIREILGYSSPRQWKIGDIRGLPAATILLGFVLYPYVYLSTRAMFMTQPSNLIHAARSLGRTEFTAFRLIALPMARPAIAIGLSLAMLETINDIGASEFLGVRTLTVSIYTRWNTQGDIAGGARFAVLLLVIILLVSFFMRDKKLQASYSNARGANVLQPKTLTGIYSFAACVLGWTPVVIGFLAPAVFLTYQVARYATEVEILSPPLIQALRNTIVIAGTATLIAIVVAIIIVWSTREYVSGHLKSKLMQCNAQIGKIGYAIPGTLLAIGLLIPYRWIDTGLNTILSMAGNHTARMYMLGSVVGVACACSIRFIAIAIGNITAGFARIPVSYDQAARSLGQTNNELLWKVHLPLIKPALLASTLLIFVECMKELPVTLMLRPLNTETLATLLYADASRGNYEESALAALIIVVIGIIPVILLTRIHVSGKTNE
jgi:iron(III) transport system permease protein